MKLVTGILHFEITAGTAYIMWLELNSPTAILIWIFLAKQRAKEIAKRATTKFPSYLNFWANETSTTNSIVVF